MTALAPLTAAREQARHYRSRDWWRDQTAVINARAADKDIRMQT